MTDSDKTIDGFAYWIDNEENGVCYIPLNLCEKIMELLKEQPQWISVKDRLPDDASDVLAYYDDGTESRIIPVNYYKRRWYDCVFNRSIDDLETGFIGYWMSLPEPPQEGVKREWLIGRKS